MSRPRSGGSRPESAPRSLARRALGMARRVAFGALGRTPFGTIVAVDTARPLAALTFDGGPDATWTPRVLDVLDAHGAKGTFFVIGKYVDAHPEIVARMHRSGHALGNHTYEHPSFPLVSSGERLRELRACERALAPYPQGRKLFRPPYLDQSVASRFDTWRLGYDVIACSVHANDWEDREMTEMTKVLTDSVEAGSIVMLHDVVCDQRYRSREAMIGALGALLTQRPEIDFVSVPELLAAGRPRREMWIKRPNVARFASYERDV
jgi:peptidoglycan-N-acetylglucosamine deacetylase